MEHWGACQGYAIEVFYGHQVTIVLVEMLIMSLYNQVKQSVLPNLQGQVLFDTFGVVVVLMKHTIIKRSCL